MLRNIVKRASVLTLLMTGFVIAARIGSSKLTAEELTQPTVCSLATLHGKYGSGTAGWINSSRNPSDVTIPTFVPFAEAALFDFDGQGSISGAATPDFGGQIDPSATPSPASGSYTIDPSTCTGTLTANVPNGPSFHRRLVIVDNAREIEFVSTDAGFVISGSLKKQSFFSNQR